MARRPSRFVEVLSPEEREILEYLKDEGETARIRHRAHAILLSDSGKSVNEIAEIFEVTRETVCAWLDRWHEMGPSGMADAARSGAPSKLTEEERKIVLGLLKKHPHSPKTVLIEIERQTGKNISARTLRRIARRAGLSWKRMRKSSRSKRSDEDFQAARKELGKLVGSHQSGECKLYFFDEAGFSLNPKVPYGWQPIGTTIEIDSQRSSQVNVLGFMDYDCNFIPYTIDGTINSEVVISCFDDFVEMIEELTFVVIDNASVHTSAAFEARRSDWEKKGLYLYYLPPYCPELNLIEILWRMIKYHWLPLKAYKNLKSLLRNLSKTMSKIGDYFTINFTTTFS